MFPCFDEPGYKSIFTFTVYYKYADYSAVWNMPIKEKGPVEDLWGPWEDMEDYYYSKYDTSMKMSPYLLALAISDYDWSTTGVSELTNTLIRVGGPEYRMKDGQGDYGVELGKRLIDGFSEYYAYNYSDSFGPNGAKSDQIGIPDFSAGAMENWGLVTYQEYLVYIKPENSYESSVGSSSYLRHIASNFL